MISRGIDPELPCENGYPWGFEDGHDNDHCPPEWPRGVRRPLVQAPGGYDVCPFHGFDEQTCQQKGCCAWGEYSGDRPGEYKCDSAVGNNPCSGDQSEFAEDDPGGSRLGEAAADVQDNICDNDGNLYSVSAD